MALFVKDIHLRNLFQILAKSKNKLMYPGYKWTLNDIRALWSKIEKFGPRCPKFKESSKIILVYANEAETSVPKEELSLIIF